MSPPQTIIARIAAYDISNIHLGGKIIFIPHERRESVQADHPTGEIAKVIAVEGTLSDIQTAKGEDLDKFLKSEEARRSGKAETAAEKITAAAATKKEPAPEQHVNPGSKVTINPILINDSFRELPGTAAFSLCGLSGQCTREKCRKLVSCWSKEINALRDYNQNNAANALENELKEILGE